jgi:hypothetical protein
MSNDKVNPETAALFDGAAKQLESVAWKCALDDRQIKQRNPAVSGWSILEHLDHLTIVNAAILGRINALLAEPAAPSGGINEIGVKIFAAGEIPRGMGKSPEFALPKTASSEAVHGRAKEATAAMRKFEIRLSEIEKSQGRAPHPVIGSLTPLEWLRFMEIHTRHHLKIVREICPEVS